MRQLFDELNQKWLEAIRDWKSIIAEKDKLIKMLEKELEKLKGDKDETNTI